MNALDLLRSVSGPDDSIERPHHTTRLPLEYDALEPRQLLSAVQATTSAETTTPQVVGATAGSAETAGIVSEQGGATSVVTHAVGDVNSLQSQIPVNDLLANLSQVTTDIYNSNTGLSVASGLTSLPITPLLAPTVTSNETPLNNGTPDLGTVWITPPPVPPGLFHPGVTNSPLSASTLSQTVNPQGGPPTFTHFGQNGNGSASAAAVNQPAAVGPLGPSLTSEIAPVQPPPAEAQQTAGPPAQAQQDETAPQQNAQTPPGGQQGAGESGTPGQGAAPGQPAATAPSQQRGAGGAASQGLPSMSPQTPGGQSTPGNGSQNPGGAGQPGSGTQAPTGGPQGGSGGAEGAGSGNVSPRRNGQDAADPHGDDTVDLIDAAIPSLVANSARSADDIESGGPLPTVFGAAVVAVGGFHLAATSPDRLRRGLIGGPPVGADPDRRRHANP
jgi:hypothetical protein